LSLRLPRRKFSTPWPSTHRRRPPAEARAALDGNLNNKEDDIREAAEKGLKLWSKKTGQVSAPELAKLENPDWKVRREAADDLREDGGPPASAVPALLTAANKEQNPKALQAMLLTLGASGAPDAKPVLDAHVADADADTRRAAHKGLKSWQAKNGQTVRKDIETPAAPILAASAPAAAPAASASAPEPAKPPPPDGCSQFKSICGSDPFALDKCKSDMKPLSYSQQLAWADCVNSSSDRCQKAHDTCMSKAKTAK